MSQSPFNEFHQSRLMRIFIYWFRSRSKPHYKTDAVILSPGWQFDDKAQWKPALPKSGLVMCELAEKIPSADRYWKSSRYLLMSSHPPCQWMDFSVKIVHARCVSSSLGLFFAMSYIRILNPRPNKFWHSPAFILKRVHQHQPSPEELAASLSENVFDMVFPLPSTGGFVLGWTRVPLMPAL